MSESRSATGGPASDRWARVPVILLMVLVLIVAGLLSAMTAMRFAIRGREVEVPDLVGMSTEDAARRLAPLELSLRAESRRFSATVPEGRIIDQTPPAGSRIKQDRGVRVLLSLGERRFGVPDLAGASLRASQLVLTERGFSLGNTIYTHTGEGEESTIVYQSPGPGDVAGTDPEVDVLVSLGSIDRYYIMPDLTARPVEEVRSELARAGFRIGPVTPVRDSRMGRGMVVRHQPRAGYKVSRTDLIILEVSQ